MRLQFLIAAALLLAAPAIADDQTAKIRDVETGLLPAIVVKGEKPAPRRIEDRMQELHVPGISVAVIDHGALAWAKAYGVVTAGAPQKITPETRFQAGSISKTLNAATALSLVVEGRLSLDEPVNAKLKGWQVPPSDKAPGYVPTLRALLSHSAGLGIHGFPGYAPGEPLPTIEQILDGKPPANTKAVRIDLKPGEWNYSGGGITIVQKLITDVTGHAFADEVQAHVIGPVGMMHSTYRFPKATDQSFATGHKADGTPMPIRWYVFPEQAAAGLWATPSDLVKFGLAVMKAKHGDGKAGIDPRVAALLLERQKGLDTGSGDTRGMGLGFFLNTLGTPDSFSHGGSTQGFHSELYVRPETGQGIVVMTNSDAGNVLIDDIMRAVSAAYGWKDAMKPREIATIMPDAAALDRVVGTYGLEMGGQNITLTIRVDGGHLIARYWDGRENALLAESADHFIDTDTGIRFVPSKEPGKLDMMPEEGEQSVTFQRKS